MIEEISKVKVTCDGCGYEVCVGNDPTHTCIPFDAQDAYNATDAAIETLENNRGWAYDYNDDEIFCPVCTHGTP